MFKVVFLGTGVSTAIPSIYHVVVQGNESCAVCQDATTNPESRNRRNNVSIALIFVDDKNIDRCVVVDIGKTMRDAFLR